MALIRETDEWVENIYLIEPNDPVEGGEDGVDNRPHIELTNRTAFLNKKCKEQEQKTQEIDDKVNGLTTKVDEIQVTIQNGGNNQSSGDLDEKLDQEIQARTEGDSHLQGQIDALKEQITQILVNFNGKENTDIVAYIKFNIIGTSSQNHHILQEIDKTGDISVQEITDLNTRGRRIAQIKLPAEFNKETHRYLIHTQPLPYDNNELAGTTYYTIVSDNDGSLVLNFHGSNTRAAYETYVSTLVTIEIKRK